MAAGAVRVAIEKNCNLEDLDITDFQRCSPLIEKDIFEYITPDGCMKNRKTTGGPAPEEVAKQIASLQDWINQ